jgi:hypothetical protein
LLFFFIYFISRKEKRERKNNKVKVLKMLVLPKRNERTVGANKQIMHKIRDRRSLSPPSFSKKEGCKDQRFLGGL